MNEQIDSQRWKSILITIVNKFTSHFISSHFLKKERAKRAHIKNSQFPVSVSNVNSQISKSRRECVRACMCVCVCVCVCVGEGEREREGIAGV